MKKIALILACVMILCVALCACSSGSSDSSGSSGSAKSISDIYQDIKSQVELTDMLEIDTPELLLKRYGIASEDVAEFAACVKSDGIDQEEIILIKATDDAAAGRVKEKLDTRYEAKLAQNKDYNPEQYAIIEKCSVDQDGLYVSMIVSPNAETIKKIYQDAIK